MAYLDGDEHNLGVYTFCNATGSTVQMSTTLTGFRVYKILGV